MTEVTDALDAPEQETENRKLGQIALLLFLTGILLFLSWLGWKVWRIYQTSNSLLARQTEIEELSEAGWREIDPDAAEELVMGLHADVVALNQDIGFLMPILPVLSPLPEIGPLAAAAPHLLEMADAGTEAAAYGVRAMKPAMQGLSSVESSESTLPLLLAATAEGRPDLASASLALDRAAAARAQITDIEALPWRVKTLIEKGDEWLSIGQNFSRFSLVLPEFAGFNGPRRYLVMAQNQDEIRPTGGFLSGAGYVELNNGQITGLEFGDANLVDAWAPSGSQKGPLVKPYASPPQPFQDFMLFDLFLFRDANFWPDFAISGQKAMDLYAYGRDIPPLDGAIGINQQFLQLLLNGLGPVTVPDTGVVISSQNIISSLQEAWTLQDGVSERKAFMGPFALAIQNRIDAGLDDIDPLHLVNQLNQSLDQKDLQIYSRDPETTAILAANNWDGRLRQPIDGDTLMLVDTNMGYNKANLLVDRAATYDVRLAAEGNSEATLNVTHLHRGEADEEECLQGAKEEYLAGAPYKALAEKCYWNYMRVYAPEGSQLLEGPQHLIPGENWSGGYDWQRKTETLSELPGFTTFESWMLLPWGEEINSQFRYTLPNSVIQEEDGVSVYNLQLLKQSGVRPHQVLVSLTLPPGKIVSEIFPQPIAKENNTYFFAIELDSDQMVTLAFK